MAGYTPAFGSIYDGTLYGKWPTAPVWATLIPLIDSRGEIRLSYEAIAGRTGWPMELLRQGIHELMQPDPDSQSPADEGRRLVLLDPTKSWGWRAVNHALYREKARLMSKAQREVESGANRARMEDRRRPPETADPSSGPPSTTSPDSNTYSDSNKKSEVPDTSSGGAGGDAPRKRSAEPKGSRIPTPFLVTAEMRKWAAEKTPHVKLDEATEDFCNYWRALPGQRSRKLDWVLTWKNRMKECEDKAIKRNGGGAPRKSFEERMAALGDDT